MSHKKDARVRQAKLNLIADNWEKISPETKRAVYKEAPAMHYLMVLITMDRNSMTKENTMINRDI